MSDSRDRPEDDLDQHESAASLYEQIVSALLSHEHVFFSPEVSPHPPLIRQVSSSARFKFGFRTIASLSLHPALEATLHILNADLPSAHFLLRHAEAPPAWECMYLHGILHRIEGDVDNARAWYGNVEESDALRAAWHPSQPVKLQGQNIDWEEWLDRLEEWKNHVLGRKSTKQSDTTAESNAIDWTVRERDLREISLREITRLLHFCETKFGIERVEDATKVWVSEGDALREKKQNMLVGGEGWRTF